jgi:hypothetical protein
MDCDLINCIGQEGSCYHSVLCSSDANISKYLALKWWVFSFYEHCFYWYQTREIARQ